MSQYALPYAPGFFLAIITALWLAQPAKLKWVKGMVIALSILSILPSFSHSQQACYNKTPSLHFFKQHLYKQYCSPNPIVWIFITIPWAGQSTRWQVASHMQFKQFYGYVNLFPPNGYPNYLLTKNLIQRSFTLEASQYMHAFIHKQKVSCLITNKRPIAAWPYVFSALPKPVAETQNPIIYHFGNHDHNENET